MFVVIQLSTVVVFMLVNEVARGFIQHCIRKGLRDATIKSHKRILETVILPAIGNKSLEHINPIDTDLLLERAIPRGCSVPIHAIVTFRRLMKYAVDSGYKLKFDWREIEVPKYRPLKSAQALVPEEIEKLRKVFDLSSPSGIRNRALMELVLHTGLRISEAIAIDIDDVDFENNEISIRNIKTREMQMVFLHGAEYWLKEYLSKRNDDNPALFVSCSNFGRGSFEDRRMTKDTAKSAMRKLRIKVSFKKTLGWHLLRKTYCTHLLLSGVDIKSVQYLARHKSERTTLKYYIALSEKRCKEAHKTVMAAL